ncbi:MAG: MBL fold metallo-hydrolase, partial [Merismopedia sp. SIO2A8]|nr:MBL fold metallo-hydrolase [Merismopedia sp. SIO2A8]
MHIHRFPVLSTNYTFMLHDQRQHLAAVVDPADAQAVLKWLKQYQATLTTIFNTHHHRDHVGGNRELLRQFPDAVVYGGANDQGRIPGQKVFLEDGDQVTFSDRTAEVYFVPGHTNAHIAYYFPPSNTFPPSNDGSESNNDPDGHEMGDLFCGDTLFAGGCALQFEKQFGEQSNYLLDFFHLSEYLAAASQVCAPDEAAQWLKT